MHYKAERTLERIDRLKLKYIEQLHQIRTQVIELGYELDEADYNTWLANHRGLLEEDYLGNDEDDEEA